MSMRRQHISISLITCFLGIVLFSSNSAAAQEDSVLVKACGAARFMTVGTTDPMFINTSGGYIPLEDSLPGAFVGDFFTFVFFDSYAANHRPMVLYTNDGLDFQPSFYLPPNEATPCTSRDSTDFTISMSCTSSAFTFQADFPNWSQNPDAAYTFGQLQVWDEDAEIFESTDLLLTNVTQTVNENVPTNLVEDGAILRFIWADITPNGVQNNFFTIPDTIRVMAPLTDSLSECVLASGSAEFDLTEAFSDENVQSFHTDSLSAFFGTSPIPQDLTTMYEAIDGDMVYARVQQESSGCFVVGTITLLTSPPPEMLSALPSLICGESSLPLELTGASPWILEAGGQNWFVGADMLWELGVVDDLQLDSELSIVDGDGCLSDPILISLAPLPALSVLPDEVCLDGILELEFSGNSPWQIESTESQLFSSPYTEANQEVIVTLTDMQTEIQIWNVEDQYCVNRDTLTIEILPDPEYNTDTLTYCGSLSGALIDVQEVEDAVSVSGSAVTILDEMDNPVLNDFEVFADTMLVFSVSQATCTLRDTLSIVIAAPNVVDLGEDLSFCVNGAAAVDDFIISELDPSITTIDMFDDEGQAYDDFEFIAGSTLSFNVPPEDTHEQQEFEMIVTIAGDTLCPSATDALSITLFPLPSISVPIASCAGDEVQLSDLMNSTAINYSIDGMDYEPAVIVSGASSFNLGSEASGLTPIYLQLTSNMQCMTADTAIVDVLSIPQADLEAYDTEVTLCAGQENAVLELVDVFDSYQWIFPPSIEDAVLNGEVNEQSVTLTALPVGMTMANFSIIVSEETEIMGQTFTCSSETEFSLSTIDSTCAVGEIYSFPGNIYVAVLENEGADATYEWLIDGQQIESGPIVALDRTPTALTVTGSHYSDGRCSCTGEYMLTGAPPIGRVLLRAFPNPVMDGRVSLALPTYFHDEPVEVFVSSLDGSLVYSIRFSSANPIVNLQLPADLKGLFGIEVRSERHVAASRMIAR